MPELQPDEQPQPVPTPTPILPTWFDLLTEELIDLLATLNQRQQAAIRRIVESGHYSDHPPAPANMIGNAPGCICTASTWWGNPRVAKSGGWRHIPWTRQPDFIRTLSLAKRRALAVLDVAEQETLRHARSLARAAAPPVITSMVCIATQTEDYKSAIGASALVLKYAGMEEQQKTVVELTTYNWWSAAEEDV